MFPKIAEHLLSIGAVSLKPNDPFTWSSGMKSPIYCDNRLTLSYPEVRKEIAKGLVQIIKEHYPDVECIAGTATAGIPHAAWVSDQLNLPMVYVRGKAKGHGKENVIEGKISRGDRVVIIEDLISTGGSVIHAAEELKKAGAEILGVAAIFSYELKKGTDNLQKTALDWHTLTNFTTMLDIAAQKGFIEKEDVKRLQQWRKKPSSTDWMQEGVSNS
ncbi:orotate phosphoribosyltransferase [Pseudalkalibacillus caeni]|uniref:Orotate phosphoribosyltransferase n=1 Tax=Exobacillus caeni TaxID=2574798 RepID=A0A5R9EWQ4_9BACL|nr:orotate phosphoribosyltransferase [Pseudalkalibacillus caeni]TLS35271.1 orotate phosphoribosyltransferase [Pseudalkalibacillus caeni]